MAQPTQNQVHIDAVLTNLSVAFMNEADNFVASKVFPTVPVTKQSDLYFTYSQADFYRDQAQYRADGTESAGSGYSLSTSTYSSQVWALHKDIGDQVRANSDSPLNPDMDATKFLAHQMMIRQERDWASKFFTTSVWGTDNTPSTLWDASGSDPIGDIQTGVNTVLSNTGYLPNTLVLSYAAYKTLRNHSDFVDRYKYTSADSITPELIGKVLDVPRVMVMKGVYNSAQEGASASYAQMGDKDALLCYVAPSAGLMTASAGYNFVWSGVGGGLGTSTAVSRFRMDHLRADRLEIESAWDFKAVSTSLGYFFSNPVSA
ncbi:Major capsid protein GpE [uncultured Caudovirales phage]|jgi:hypothetical protein|uniref:Major capsid protein GpE n=1 Tax=uncultured Caudovirales phage TaxID=2100421 RepID=A0A6J5NDG0_9CAUD|nr:Major capsid protein GpE [uncultured Caudovirales phage]